MGKFRINGIIAGLIFISVFSCGDVICATSLQLPAGTFVSVESVLEVSAISTDEIESCSFLFQVSAASKDTNFIKFYLVDRITNKDVFCYSLLSRAPPL